MTILRLIVIVYDDIRLTINGRGADHKSQCGKFPLVKRR